MITVWRTNYDSFLSHCFSIVAGCCAIRRRLVRMLRDAPPDSVWAPHRVMSCRHLNRQPGEQRLLLFRRLVLLLLPVLGLYRVRVLPTIVCLRRPLPVHIHTQCVQPLRVCERTLYIPSLRSAKTHHCLMGLAAAGVVVAGERYSLWIVSN